uniref:BPTI/Kunitz domain-containing protein-like n=1 Tax=Pogona vitticeps TaxID=103695 RepID=A0ABM5EPV0_9SAUR
MQGGPFALCLLIVGLCIPWFQLLGVSAQDPLLAKCKLPKEPGRCRVRFGRFYYNVKSGRCEEFVYSGCHGNANRFRTRTQCIKECAGKNSMPPNCDFPPETGSCKASMPRYYFNVRSRRCEEFIYGGCGGNSNNFRTEMDCMHKCVNYKG